MKELGYYKSVLNDYICKYNPTWGIHWFTIDCIGNPFELSTHKDSIIKPYKPYLNSFTKLLCKGKMCDRYVDYNKVCESIILNAVNLKKSGLL